MAPSSGVSPSLPCPSPAGLTHLCPLSALQAWPGLSSCRPGLLVGGPAPFSSPREAALPGCSLSSQLSPAEFPAYSLLPSCLPQVGTRVSCPAPGDPGRTAVQIKRCGWLHMKLAGQLLPLPAYLALPPTAWSCWKVHLELCMKKPHSPHPEARDLASNPSGVTLTFFTPQSFPSLVCNLQGRKESSG